MELLFWISLFLIVYTFIGYGVLLYGLVLLKRVAGMKQKELHDDNRLPSCALVIAAYNEAPVLSEKVLNSLALDYPEELLQIYVVSDGSDDNTSEVLQAFRGKIIHLHRPERKGKVHAVHRAVIQTKEDVLVFTDANTMLNREALKKIIQHYANKSIGAVAGEKRVDFSQVADASSAGEGIYWKYESKLKSWDFELYSAIGAAGELFSIRRDLYTAVPSDTILDDFMISMEVVRNGFRIAYEPDAYAVESGSESIPEEFKRKVRIAAGGLQSIIRLKDLLFLRKNLLLSFQYVSHRVLRWTITPFLLGLVFVLNHFLAFQPGGPLYSTLLLLQYIFYSLALIGFIYQKKSMKFAFIPFYFCMMNYAVYKGILRFLQKKQSSTWDKAKRKSITA